ncbi:unnamed protein product [Ostreobium quekettii]|uniref:Uncharacterized protein n=1 Tax=Ostreobium quekettii TaxID=121088 RepID=A0A8S1IVE0_9CHLO|nr:unnamed protein product [Ostreobium quekettii]
MLCRRSGCVWLLQQSMGQHPSARCMQRQAQEAARLETARLAARLGQLISDARQQLCVIRFMICVTGLWRQKAGRRVSDMCCLAARLSDLKGARGPECSSGAGF